MREKYKKEKYKKFKKNRILILTILLLLISAASFSFIYDFDKPPAKDKDNIMYVAGTTSKIDLYDSKFVKKRDISRGSKVDATKTETNNKDVVYIKIRINKEEFYILKNNLVKNVSDSVKESKIYVRTPTSLYLDLDKGDIGRLLDKGMELNVIGYDKLLDDGTVNAYKIKLDDGTIGYIYSKYVVYDKDTAMLNNEPYYDIHSKRKDVYSGVGGSGGDLDYYPFDKPKFTDNVMPNKVYALYLNGGVINNVDAYIEYAKTTKINAFVVDIKDNQAPAYASLVYKQYSPTNYSRALNSFDKYKEAMQKIKNAGFYLIGRITTFKDGYYVSDNLDTAIIDKRTDKPFVTAGTYWPSPFQRKVWEFNVNLAKEAVKDMGFNEIQFDYARFPDRIVSQDQSGYLDFRNDYNEEKVQAIQRFLMYACDELHKLHAYVSVDVFGESVNSYITAYGQYWPAMSNVVDVISGMPYPDHFSANSYGIAKPWEDPYDLIYDWSAVAAIRQKEIPTPAITRTWILAQNTMYGNTYGSEQIEGEIKGLFDAGLTGGYMTWSSSSYLDGYKSRTAAYIKEY